MNYLENYFNTIESDSEKQKIMDFFNKAGEKFFQNFDYRSIKNVVLPTTSSYETSQIFSTVAVAANNGFDIFIILTKNKNSAYNEISNEALYKLHNFCVCTENDFVRFQTNKMQKPVLLVLKKNSAVLKTWRNILLNCVFLHGRPLLIVNSSGDFSKGTKMFQYISDIKNCANSCIIFKVTEAD
mgnify:CR=1 FL=1